MVAAARSLLKLGVHNVLVTLAERGSVLVTATGDVITQEAVPVPGGVVVDGTAAGVLLWQIAVTACFKEYF